MSQWQHDSSVWYFIWLVLQLCSRHVKAAYCIPRTCADFQFHVSHLYMFTSSALFYAICGHAISLLCQLGPWLWCNNHTAGCIRDSICGENKKKSLCLQKRCIKTFGTLHNICSKWAWINLLDTSLISCWPCWPLSTSTWLCDMYSPFVCDIATLVVYTQSVQNQNGIETSPYLNTHQLHIHCQKSPVYFFSIEKYFDVVLLKIIFSTWTALIHVFFIWYIEYNVKIQFVI